MLGLILDINFIKELFGVGFRLLLVGYWRFQDGRVKECNCFLSCWVIFLEMQYQGSGWFILLIDIIFKRFGKVRRREEKIVEIVEGLVKVQYGRRVLGTVLELYFSFYLWFYYIFVGFIMVLQREVCVLGIMYIDS